MSSSTISTPKLTMRIERVGDTTLRATILQMDERARVRRSTYTASNGFRIACYDSPQLCQSSLLIRGDERALDDQTVSYPFSTRAEREEYIGRMTEALHEWAAKAPVFGGTTDGIVITRSFVHADVTFVKPERSLVMQVTRMDDAFRSTGPAKTFKASNGITIRSYSSPYFSGDMVNIHGENHEYNYTVAERAFSSNADRDTYFNRVLAALAEWDTQYEAWKPAAPAVCCPACCHRACCAAAGVPPSEFILTV